MPAPTAPVDVTVTLDQVHVDALWNVIETDFPTLTGPQITAKLEEWCMEGISSGVAVAIRRRARTVADSAATDFTEAWTS